MGKPFSPDEVDAGSREALTAKTVSARRDPPPPAPEPKEPEPGKGATNPLLEAARSGRAAEWIPPPNLVLTPVPDGTPEPVAALIREARSKADSLAVELRGVSRAIGFKFE